MHRRTVEVARAREDLLKYDSDYSLFDEGMMKKAIKSSLV